MLIHEAFGKKLKQLRKENKLTQKVLAENSDLSIDYIHDLEHGLKNPSLKVLEALARALNLKTSELIREVEELIELNKS